ncbi:MAG: DUF2797 domain-containing protein [Proteobacteria bacterium]|nr:DUF2797 domain-containing protein [Pseudomonadota bacterium]
MMFSPTLNVMGTRGQVSPLDSLTLGHQLLQVFYDIQCQDQTSVELNSWLGRQIAIEFTGQKECVRCQRSIKKTFSRGYCFPCFRSRPETDLCIVKPELCHYHKGTCRDPGWGENHCMQKHSIYLAYTSQFKVGLTRSQRMTSRWMDQGAALAIEIATTNSRLEAGQLEVELKHLFKDKTQPKAMLQNPDGSSIGHQDPLVTELVSQRSRALAHLSHYPGSWQASSGSIHYLSYPRASGQIGANKLAMSSLDKTHMISGKLTAIRGQYLVLDHSECFSMRKHAGYLVNISLT